MSSGYCYRQGVIDIPVFSCRDGEEAFLSLLNWLSGNARSANCTLANILNVVPTEAFPHRPPDRHRPLLRRQEAKTLSPYSPPPSFP